MGFRIDFDVVEILAKVENKGRLINQLVREWAKAKNRDERDKDTDPAWDQIEDEMKQNIVIIKDYRKGENMKMRKIRIVADSCPLKKKNCNICVYSYGTESNKVYCNYGDKDRQTIAWRGHNSPLFLFNYTDSCRATQLKKTFLAQSISV